jgi:hypothetical protein
MRIKNWNVETYYSPKEKFPYDEVLAFSFHHAII